MDKAVELLAPAGTFEALIAAIQNGADAVYIGGNRFGARAFAGNFSDEEIVEAVKYAHIRDVKIYVTVNTLISDESFDDCMEFVRFLYQADVDALILQDFGLSKRIAEQFPDFEIHASTQMSIANSQDAIYYKNEGFKRIVLARENSAEEIKRIKQTVDIETEAFIHGSLCVSYSGKCLFSYFNGGRSANQGACAQPCRKQYTFSENRTSNYFLSTKDLSTINHIETLLANGVDSLKIEGRMKRPEYVATVVGAYREAVDAVLSAQKCDFEKLELRMASVFNRQFTKGYVLGEIPNMIVNTGSPNNIGIPVGKVVEVDKKNKKITILLDRELNKGDGLSLGEYVGRILHNKKEVITAYAGQRIQLDYVGNHVSVGDTVQKTSDRIIINQATESLRRENKKINLEADITIKADSYPQIMIKDPVGNSVIYKEITEKASRGINHSLCEEEIITQLKKTEDTPYVFSNINIKLDPGSFLKKATLNALRRNALALISKRRAQRYPGRMQLSEIKKNFPKKEATVSGSVEPVLSVKCATKPQIESCIANGIRSVYVDSYDNYRFAENHIEKVYFCVPHMLKDAHIDELDPFIERYRPNVLASSIGYIHYLHDKYMQAGISRSLRLDYYFNAYNYDALEILKKQNIVDSVTLSLEHPIFLQKNSFRVNELAELMLYAHPIYMVTEYCPYKTKAECKNCKVDNQRLKAHDGGENLCIKRDLFCRMQIIPSKPSDFSANISFEKNSGITKYRIDFLNESKEEADFVIKSYIGKRYGQKINHQSGI